MADTNIPIIEIKGVRKYFRNVKAVDGIDLEIKRGEYIALLGPNGAGKTTLVEMIEGIQQPNQGEIRIKGKTWKENKNEILKCLGISLQETRFVEKLTVNETLNLFASFYRLDSKRVDEIIDLVGLSEKKKTMTVHLSGGQKQRLALGIALLNKPEILLLDEPTTGLDPTARKEIWDILLNLKNLGNTSMILTTHYMEEAENLCDRIVIMHKGKTLVQGSLNEILVQSSLKELVKFQANNLNEEFLKELKNIGFDVQRDMQNHHYKFIVEDIQTQIPLFLDYTKKHRITLSFFECKKLNLNDLFLQLTGRTLEDE